MSLLIPLAVSYGAGFTAGLEGLQPLNKRPECQDGESVRSHHSFLAFAERALERPGRWPRSKTVGLDIAMLVFQVHGIEADHPP
jgi:hypothetical protein